VDLRGNNLGDNGAMIVGRCMRQMQSSALRKIDLGYNEIADDGAFTIANVRFGRDHGSGWKGWGLMVGVDAKSALLRLCFS